MSKLFQSKGIVTTYVLVFGAIFVILLSALLGFVLMQLKSTSHQIASAEAFEIAEAGIEYYKWCLNNEITGECELQKDYKDADGVTIGTFSLEIQEQISCGESIARTIISTGWTSKFPDKKRQIQVLYARTSVAQYSYLLNDNVWAGSDRELRGLYHSNGGIRMDGENQSLVSSAKEEWVCTSSFGCSPCPTSSDPPCHMDGSDCICPGVFTTTDNANPDLFSSPVPPFDFDGITVDLAQIKEIADDFPQQYYWPPATDINPEAEGYHIKLRNDGTFEVWIITDLEATYAYSLEEDWHYDYFVIESEYQYGDSISIDPNCSVIFIEDNAWIEGEAKGKFTIASANLISPGEETDVVLPGNIDYTALDGSDGFAIIAERNILISPNSPNQMEIRGIFIAQNGHFGRNHYPDNIKDKLEIYGAIVSNGRVGTKWSSGGQIVSGYLKRENYFDPNLIYLPPPFVPSTVSEFKIVSWEEVE